jgi:fatty-acyl-CoA synthase
VLQYATARVGAILVNVNPAYRLHELEYALKHSGVSTLVLARSFRQADYVAMVREVRLRCPDLRETLVLEEDWADLKHDALRLSDEALHEVERGLQFDDPINIQYTSGTTGFPKGATLSHHNILNNGYFIGEFLKYTEADRVCIPVPLYHPPGASYRAARRGSSARVATRSCSATGAIRTRRARRSTTVAGCTRATSRPWTSRAT